MQGSLRFDPSQICHHTTNDLPDSGLTARQGPFLTGRCTGFTSLTQVLCLNGNHHGLQVSWTKTDGRGFGHIVSPKPWLAKAMILSVLIGFRWLWTGPYRTTTRWVVERNIAKDTNIFILRMFDVGKRYRIFKHTTRIPYVSLCYVYSSTVGCLLPRVTTVAGLFPLLAASPACL